MSDRLIKISFFAVALACIVGSGCIKPKCPEEWLASVEEAQRSANGGWLQMLYKLDDDKVIVYGELIAIDKDSIFWLEDDNLRSLARENVGRIQLFTYRSQHSLLTAWTVLGSLSTISHGVILIVSAPAWILFGSLATGAVSREPIIGYVSEGRHPSSLSDWLRLSGYARFPQGIPPDLDRSLIRAKPPDKSRAFSNESGRL